MGAFQRSPRSSRELRTWATRFLLNESNATAAGGDIMSCGCCYYYEDDEEYYKRNETSADSTQNQTSSLRTPNPPSVTPDGEKPHVCAHRHEIVTTKQSAVGGGSSDPLPYDTPNADRTTRKPKKKNRVRFPDLSSIAEDYDLLPPVILPVKQSKKVVVKYDIVPSTSSSSSPPTSTMARKGASNYDIPL